MVVVQSLAFGVVLLLEFLSLVGFWLTRVLLTNPEFLKPEARGSGPFVLNRKISSKTQSNCGFLFVSNPGQR